MTLKILELSQKISQKGLKIASILKRLDLSRSTFYYQKGLQMKPKEILLRNAIRDLALRHKTYGYKKITWLLKKEGFKVNHKKIYRIWKEEGLGRYAILKSKKRFKKKVVEFRPTEATFAGEIFEMDIIFDSLSDGRTIKIFNVIDIFSRKAFEPLVDFSITGKDIAEHLERLFKKYGEPRIIRRDNDVRFGAKEYRVFIAKRGIKEEAIPPGQPFNNGFIESFHRLMRRECLNRELFNDIFEAREKIREWIEEYNSRRLHGSLGYRTPMEIWSEEKLTNP